MTFSVVSFQKKYQARGLIFCILDLHIKPNSIPKQIICLYFKYFKRQKICIFLHGTRNQASKIYYILEIQDSKKLFPLQGFACFPLKAASSYWSTQHTMWTVFSTWGQTIITHGSTHIALYLYWHSMNCTGFIPAAFVLLLLLKLILQLAKCRVFICASYISYTIDRFKLLPSSNSTRIEFDPFIANVMGGWTARGSTIVDFEVP